MAVARGRTRRVKPQWAKPVMDCLPKSAPMRIPKKKVTEDQEFLQYRQWESDRWFDYFMTNLRKQETTQREVVPLEE